MANRIKYHSEEERKAANRAYCKKFRENELAGKNREEVANPCKHKIFKYEDSIKSVIGTLDRTHLDTAYIELMVSISYTNDEAVLKLFRDNTRKAFNDWLRNQTMWDRVNRIIVIDYATLNHKYNGKNKSFTIQAHVRRDEITNWKTTVENLKGLSDVLVEEIKKTCVDTGLPLKKWKSKEVLTDPLSPGATEEQS